MSEALRLAQALVALRQAAEVEVRETQALSPDKPLTAFEKECIRTAFKGGAAYATKAAYTKGYEDAKKDEITRLAEEQARDLCDQPGPLCPNDRGGSSGHDPVVR